MIAPDEVVAKLATFADPAKRHPNESQAAADERRLTFLRAMADELWTQAYAAGVKSVPLPERAEVKRYLCGQCPHQDTIRRDILGEVSIGFQAPVLPPMPFDPALTRRPARGNDGADKHRPA